MVAKNDITGDDIKTKGVSKEYENNFDRIFGKKNKVASDKATSDKFAECPEHDTCFCQTPCGVNGGRVNVIGQNGNNGEHYESEQISKSK